MDISVYGKSGHDIYVYDISVYDRSVHDISVYDISVWEETNKWKDTVFLPWGSWGYSLLGYHGTPPPQWDTHGTHPP